VPELLRLLRVEPGPLRPLEPEEPAPGVRTWRPPTPAFALTRVDLDRAADGVILTAEGPQVLFCLSGTVCVADADGAATLPPGQAGYVRSGRGPVTLTGDGVAFRTTTG
jgi:mannose-6-phosphate isomerase